MRTKHEAYQRGMTLPSSPVKRLSILACTFSSNCQTTGLMKAETVNSVPIISPTQRIVSMSKDCMEWLPLYDSEFEVSEASRRSKSAYSNKSGILVNAMRVGAAALASNMLAGNNVSSPYL